MSGPDFTLRGSSSASLPVVVLSSNLVSYFLRVSSGCLEFNLRRPGFSCIMADSGSSKRAPTRSDLHFITAGKGVKFITTVDLPPFFFVGSVLFFTWKMGLMTSFKAVGSFSWWSMGESSGFSESTPLALPTISRGASQFMQLLSFFIVTSMPTRVTFVETSNSVFVAKIRHLRDSRGCDFAGFSVSVKDGIPSGSGEWFLCVDVPFLSVCTRVLCGVSV